LDGFSIIFKCGNSNSQTLVNIYDCPGTVHSLISTTKSTLLCSLFIFYRL